MMRNDFWQGLIFGSFIAFALSAVIAPMVRLRRKPLLEQGKDALNDTTRDFIRQAKRAQNQFMKKIG